MTSGRSVWNAIYLGLQTSIWMHVYFSLESSIKKASERARAYILFNKTKLVHQLRGLFYQVKSKLVRQHCL